MMTDYQTGPVSRNCAGLPSQEHSNCNQRRRRSNYDEYSESCYDDDDPDEDDSEQDGICQCMRCPAHLFTSVLLGLLACVLVTGGVFLAFHKWDHTWLLVSGIGVILMAIGTAMHCCSTPNSNKQTGSHRCKGSCAGGNNNGSRNHPHQKGTEIISNGSVLTEQLLPLSNTRSVSQLSLNMVPGYFPPLVYSANGAPYTLEQHSSVVQNINRLVQHQTQLHLQQPETNIQPGMNGAKSFILVPLPSQGADATSIQNIVAAVCQLDVANTQDVENSITETIPPPVSLPLAVNENSSNNAATAGQLQQSVQTIPFLQPSYKHVEVQTCNEWNPPNQIPNEGKPVISAPNVTHTNNPDCSSNTTTEFSCQTSSEAPSTTCLLEINCNNLEEPHPSNVSELPNENNILQQNNVVSSETPCNDISCDNPLTDSIPNLLTFDDLTSGETSTVPTSVVNESETATAICIEDIPETQLNVMSQESIQNVTAVPIPDSALTLNSTITTESIGISNNGNQQPDVTENENAQNTADIPEILEPSTLDNIPNSSENVPAIANEDNIPADFSDFDESEFLERSSPPPSYEDVAQETVSSGGVFGVSYGTM